MSEQHTPGPWIVIERLHPYKDGSKSHIERGIYTQQIQPQLKDHWPVVCMSFGIGMNGEKAIPFVRIKEADAKLIASAPQMLEALLLADAMLSGANMNASVVEKKVRSAIAAATGGTSADDVPETTFGNMAAQPAQQRWAVFCGGCRKEWSAPYQHPGKSICTECEAKCKDAPPAQPAVPLTERDLASACLSYRHDFGLMDETNRGLLMFQAREWARAFGLIVTAAAPEKGQP
jgi:hypothetical protein